MTEEQARDLLKELLEFVDPEIAQEMFPEDDDYVYEEHEDDIYECVSIILRHVRENP